MAKVAAGSGLKQAIFRNAFNISAAKTRTGDRNSVLDSVVWKKVGAEAGLGNVKIMSFCIFLLLQEHYIF